MTRIIPFYQHGLGEPEVAAVAEVFKGPILTTGDYTRRFENAFSDYFGGGYVVALNSCTSALHLSLLANGVGQGDEVITTPLTFVATATAIMQAGAKPVFVDVEPSTGNLDAERIEAAITSRTKVIIPVHLYGAMCDMRAIQEVANRHGLTVVEDSAHCIEGERDGVRPGQLGDTACFSFYATKNLACGEGGAVLTSDQELARQIRLLSLHGMDKTAADRERRGYSHWDMTVMGWKCNLDNIHAAILLSQLNGLKERYQQRATLAKIYLNLLDELNDIAPVLVPDTVSHAWHLFVIRVPADIRDQLIAHLNKNGVGAVVNYRAIHLLSFFRERFGFSVGDFPNAERIGNEVISLPFHPSLQRRDANYVFDVINQFMRTDQFRDCRGTLPDLVAHLSPQL